MRQQPLPYRIALGGTLASFCLLFLFITGVLPMFYLIMPMLCSLLILIMAETTSPYWAFIMYLAVGVLSLFITPNKDASLIFILFFGHYPLLRPYLSRIRPGILRILIKLAVDTIRNQFMKTFTKNIGIPDRLWIIFKLIHDIVNQFLTLLLRADQWCYLCADIGTYDMYPL